MASGLTSISVKQEIDLLLAHGIRIQDLQRLQRMFKWSNSLNVEAKQVATMTGSLQKVDDAERGSTTDVATLSMSIAGHHIQPSIITHPALI